MARKYPKGMKIKTAGHWEPDELTFWAWPSSCGDVKDGVAFDNGDGFWVIDFKDFEKMYLAAKEFRSLGASHAP